MPRRRILMVTSSLGYGGSEGSLSRIAGYLAKTNDVSIALMSRGYGGSGYNTAGTDTELPLVLLDENRPTGKSAFFPAASKFARWSRMRKRLAELKSENDITISFLSGPNLLNSLAGFSERTVLSERGSKLHDNSQRLSSRLLWLRLLDPIAYRGSASIVCASDGLAGEVSAAFPRLSHQVRAIEGTVETDAILLAADAEVPKAYSVLSNYRTVVGYGRMHPQKGFDFLLRVFAEVRQHVEDARLLLIGDGPALPEYELLAANLGLRVGRDPVPEAADVIFAGYQANPVRFLKLAHVFAFPSRYEGLPNTLIEALASGLPMLSSDCPWGPRSILSGSCDLAIPEAIRSPYTLAHGTLMPTPDSASGETAWVNELRTVLCNARPRRSVQESREAIARFDIAVTGPRWLKLIDDIIERQVQ